MAPACTGSRLPALLKLLFVVTFLSILCQDFSGLLVYDRQALFNLKCSHELFLNHNFEDQASRFPPHLASVPAYLLRSPVSTRRKRPRKRGKRGGVLVRVKAYWRANAGIIPLLATPGNTALQGSHGLRWIQPVTPVRLDTGLRHLPLAAPLHKRLAKRRGVDLGRLRLLRRSSTRTPQDMTIHLGLLNARSLANKTFLLNDFFTLRNLDFMLLTETWLQVGESSPFSELVPPNCYYLNCPRMSGRGGGLATIYKSSYVCRQVPIDPFSSFELQTFTLSLDTPVLCALVYRPPKFNKDFIQDFSDLLTGLLLRYDQFLIVGDFNIHVCCESRPLAKDFLNLIDAFNLTQSVLGSTHEKGHTLDLVLSFGLNVNLMEICETHFSDHFAVLFSITLPHTVVSPCASARRVRTIKLYDCVFVFWSVQCIGNYEPRRLAKHHAEWSALLFQ
ncbi:uncharacterized protein LOC129411985 [Boleophthalmus pectinirostris]|uniref:uncharacterized protein LOC129411985 n=1 Tax=Boleophthalmus pectinirostris TaxID=150288 RepID=UPI0024312962|nr:uncharacterized protein LOC129411985 [Boleophthalmus pectinirostris]